MSTALERYEEDLKKDLGEIEMGVATEGYTLATALREVAEKGQVQQLHGGWYNDQGMVCALSAVYLDARARGLI